MPVYKARLYRLTMLFSAAVFVLTALLSAVSVEAQSKSSLRRRQQQISGQRSSLRNQLKKSKAEELTAKNELVSAQRELSVAERNLKAAQWQLESTRSSIRRVRQDLAATEATMQRHRNEMSERILVMYKAGTPSYLEVMLNATDFQDFSNRAEFNRRMAAEDTRLLDAMMQHQKKREQQRTQLRQKETEQIELRKKVTEERNEVAAKQKVATAAFNKAKSSRANVEAQLKALAEASAAIERELAAIARGSYSSRAYKGKFAGTFGWPARGRISSPFGQRIHPILHTPRMHTGVDIACSSGTPIRAAATGRIIRAGWYGAYGNCVIIDHGSGKSTLYGHLSSISVGSGQVVSKGQMVGRCGSTGWSTGPHLHFEIRTNGSPRNPLDYL